MTGRVVTPYEGTGSAPWDEQAIDSPLRLHRTPVKVEWSDYNGHMSESCYLLVFGDSADAFFRLIGIDEGYRASKHSLYTVETHLRHLGEAHVGDELALSLQLLDYDHKRVHVFHQMANAATGTVLATAEQMLVHVSTAEGRSVAIPAEVAARLGAIRRAHLDLPVPHAVGATIGIRRG